MRLSKFAAAFLFILALLSIPPFALAGESCIYQRLLFGKESKTYYYDKDIIITVSSRDKNVVEIAVKIGLIDPIITREFFDECGRLLAKKIDGFYPSLEIITDNDVEREIWVSNVNALREKKEVQWGTLRIVPRNSAQGRIKQILGARTIQMVCSFIFSTRCPIE